MNTVNQIIDINDITCINALETKFIDDHKNRKDFEITDSMLFYLRRAAVAYYMMANHPNWQQWELVEPENTPLWESGTFSKIINRALVCSED